MKKLHKSLFMCLLACVAAAGLTLGFAACGDSTEEQVGPSTYTIEAPPASNIYTLSGLPQSAAEGDSVTFTLTLTDPENSWLGEITIEPAFEASFEVTPSSDGRCTFTMPACDVEILIDAGAYSEVLSDGGVTFSSANATTLVVGATNDGYRNDNFDYVECWSYNIGLGWQASALSPRSYATSSNQSVIPDDAITIIEGSKGNNWYFTTAKIAIDTSKITAGTTWLEIYLQSNNSSSSNGTVVVKITVVESIALTTMNETVKIDFNGYAEEGDDILVRFYDQDYIANSTVNGQPASIYVEVAGKVGADGTADFSFAYVTGHRYRIEIYKGTEWYTGNLEDEDGSPSERVLVLEDNDVVEHGSSVTGFDQYVDGYLSFVNADASITLKVKGTFREVNWPSS